MKNYPKIPYKLNGYVFVVFVVESVKNNFVYEGLEVKTKYLSYLRIDVSSKVLQSQSSDETQ